MAENNKIYHSDGSMKKVTPQEIKIHSGFNNDTYLSILENMMIPSIEQKYRNFTNNEFGLDRLLFIQDNATVHTKNNDKNTNNENTEEIKSSKSILTKSGIELEIWPPYSPDLNPVENIWAMLNKIKNDKIDEIILYNELNNIKINLPKNKKEMYAFMKICWEELDNQHVINCYDSYLDRLVMCRDANGDNNFNYSRKRKRN